MNSRWHAALPGLTLTEKDLHVWRVSLVQPVDFIGELETVLSDDERERAGHFRFKRDQNRYIVSRGILRKLLGSYVNRSPEVVDFEYGPYGKPSLGGCFAESGIRFNLSHSNDLAVYAFAVGCEVGIDIEQIQPLADLEIMAEHTFSMQEYNAWKKMPPDHRVSGFFTYWVLKEAYIKARGSGFSFPPDLFSVSAEPGEKPTLVEVIGEPGEPGRWILECLMPRDGYIGALAIEGKEVRQFLIDFITE